MRRRAAKPSSSTERVHPRADDLDLCRPVEIVRRLHREDLEAVKAVGRVLPQIARAAEWIVAALSSGGRLFYVGAGTSGRLGVLDAAELPPTFGTPPGQVIALMAGGDTALKDAAEGAEDDRRTAPEALRAHGLSSDDVVVGLSASARTPYVLAALAYARRKGARTVLVACNAHASARAAQMSIVPVTGAELIAGSTRMKAGTATKLVLNALSTTVMVGMGRVYRGRMVTLRPTNEKLRRRAVEMVQVLSGLSLPKSRALLSAAGGEPRLALAMHFTGLPAEQARARVEALGLRELEPGRTKRRTR